MNSASAPEAMQPPSELESGNHATGKGRVLAWASWDWGSAAFNAVMTTFVFTVYLTSNAFGGEDRASAVLGGALAVAGVAIALLAPVTGQRSDIGGRRKLWLGVNTAAVAILTALCFFVFPRPEFLLLGVSLIALGNVFFEFAGVNYNAMLAQISTPKNIGKVSGFGWGMGYLGGIVALLIVLQLFVQPSFDWFGASTENSLNIRLVAVFSALWFFIFALPVLFAVPELPRPKQAKPLGFIASYRLLFRRIKAIYATSPHTIYFLLASAVFRDGLAAVFTFGGIIAAGTFGFELPQVIFFAIFGNVVAAIGAVIGGFLDDRAGPKAVIVGSLVGLLIAGTMILVLGNGDYVFFGLAWAAAPRSGCSGCSCASSWALRSPRPGPIWPGWLRTASRANSLACMPPPGVPSASSPPPCSPSASQWPRPWWPRRGAAVGNPGHHGGSPCRASGPAAGEVSGQSPYRSGPRSLARTNT